MSAVDAAVAAARAALPALEPLPARSALLRAVADRLDAHRAELVALAGEETALPAGRLDGELTRTTFQLRFLAELADDGRVLAATIDHADPGWPMGPRPDLRRAGLPIGPVVVFAASNFPFAFSVAGGDTAAAWAAGCPVLLKVHPGHPRLSRRVAQVAQAGDALRLLESEEDGRAAVVHPGVKAGAFTGSIPGGRALFDLACSRPEPIPFYAEMGSLNPVFVTERAARARGPQLAAGFAGSVTLGAGQFCTKPGLLAVPESFDLTLLSEALTEAQPATLLNDRIAAGYAHGMTGLTSAHDVQVLVAGGQDGRAVRPTLLATTPAAALAQRETLLAECFGPVSVVVRYATTRELLELAECLPGQLTATIHAEPGDPDAAPLLRVAREKAGRVLFGGWPTGVSVSWAMHHGGPYPATSVPGATSVGAAAVERFVRPICYQDVPDDLLPEPLREANPYGITRTVDGQLVPQPRPGRPA